ncbi:MAG: hypothetical protein ACF8TS_00860 [Maioricimonas sp. JB049]
MCQLAPPVGGGNRQLLRRRYQSVGLFLRYRSLDGDSPLIVRPPGDDSDNGDDSSVQIVRIEEDWELLVTGNEPCGEPPRILTVFGPADPTWGAHAQFELRPGITPGVVDDSTERQCWWYDLPGRGAPAGEERISFTTLMSVQGSDLEMAVIREEASGGRLVVDSSRLSIAVNTSRTSLNSHHPDDSLVHTRVAAGKQCVRHFARTSFRRYSAEGLVSVDHQWRVIHPVAEDGRAVS